MIFMGSVQHIQVLPIILYLITLGISFICINVTMIFIENVTTYQVAPHYTIPYHSRNLLYLYKCYYDIHGKCDNISKCSPFSIPYHSRNLLYLYKFHSMIFIESVTTYHGAPHYTIPYHSRNLLYLYKCYYDIHGKCDNLSKCSPLYYTLSL